MIRALEMWVPATTVDIQGTAIPLVDCREPPVSRAGHCGVLRISSTDVRRDLAIDDTNEHTNLGRTGLHLLGIVANLAGKGCVCLPGRVEIISFGVVLRM